MAENRAVLAQAIEDWNNDNLSEYLKLYDPSVVLHGLSPGIDAVRAIYEGIWTAFPRSRLTLDDVLAEDDKVACRYTWRAKRAENGELVTMPGITILHFREGRCVERWDFEGQEQSVP
jgi:predicted ester cyclase